MKEVLKRHLDNPFNTGLLIVVSISFLAFCIQFILDEKIALLFLLGGFAVLLFMNVVWKRELYGLWIILFLFYFLPFNSLDPSRWDYGPRINLYERIGNMFSTWDILVFAIIGAWIFKRMVNGSFRIRWIEYGEIKLFLGMSILSAFIGMMHVKGSFFSYGPTRIIDVLALFLPVYYFAVTYIFTINFIENKRDLKNTLRVIKTFNVALILYGIYRAVGIYAGYISSLPGIIFPIIFTNQATMMFYPLFFTLAARLMRIRLFLVDKVIALFFLFFILQSTRRLLYVFLIAGIMLTVLIVYKSGFIKKTTIMAFIMKAIIVIIIVIMCILLIFPDFISAVYDSVQSIYILSKIGLETGGSVRKLEIVNAFMNLHESPWHYLFGFGLGTWIKEIKDASFDKDWFPGNQEEFKTGYFSVFSIPYIGLLFRFGLIGSIMLFIIVLCVLERGIRFIRNPQFSPFFRAHIIALLSHITIYLLVIGDSSNPTASIFCGFLYGLMTSIDRLCIRASGTDGK